MRKFKLFLFVGLVVATAFTPGGCGSKDASRNTKAKATFKPGKLMPFEEAKIGFSILRPDNVSFSVSKDTAVLAAKGFPKVTVTLLCRDQNVK